MADKPSPFDLQILAQDRTVRVYKAYVLHHRNQARLFKRSGAVSFYHVQVRYMRETLRGWRWHRRQLAVLQRRRDAFLKGES